MYYQGSRRQEGGMNVFEGSRRQRGGNLFATMKRVLVPLAKAAVPHLKRTGKDLLKRGVKVGVGSVSDALRQKDLRVGQALKQRAAQAINRASTDYLGEPLDIPFQSQDGAGMRNAPAKKKKKSINNVKQRKKVKKTKRRDIFS